jgi:hypothetical protein
MTPELVSEIHLWVHDMLDGTLATQLPVIPIFQSPRTPVTQNSMDQSNSFSQLLHFWTQDYVLEGYLNGVLSQLGWLLLLLCTILPGESLL